MIRSASPADTARAVELLRDSHAAAGFDGTGRSGFAVPFEAAYAERLFARHLEMMNGCALVHEVQGRAEGLLLAIAHEHPFGPVWLASETVWWIDPAHRGYSALAMLDAYEAWASGKGCKFAGMAGMGDDPVIARLYARRGYFKAETHFLKAV
ncbi:MULTISPECIES: GCN5 family acetyltransferase [unclassified Bradyrhizobium]|uniref:GCN5 family acetyltransferase n=1 Tax=unclassified Bradyrhizobium TaxID=2631580 RepID=UPI00211F228B|nr:MULTISPECIES: GCN5 family acetyltransferase [unclassified Bradyrhizobium]MDD1534556.1 GCN5 family acetyltransferase [Bradyrhizobium sp. WBOS8]MDD1581420.1 GCN5 family acetyltransferase [Bradyrhizobium sp. WBOS4]UUO51415.1 GCN5 family acetyltransferase [Bradyrhizobium sp. WBOS04]UUO63321.1 GCN5 family acetyltransferase [Bradyrhizobium sp. WBOS08]